MCCFRLHFSDFNVLFFKKNLLQVTFEKNNIFCKKREKNLSQGKVPTSPLDIKWSVPKAKVTLFLKNIITHSASYFRDKSLV